MSTRKDFTRRSAARMKRGTSGASRRSPNRKASPSRPQVTTGAGCLLRQVPVAVDADRRDLERAQVSVVGVAPASQDDCPRGFEDMKEVEGERLGVRSEILPPIETDLRPVGV